MIEGYIHHVSHALNLFLSHLISFGNTLVNRQVKGHERLISLLKILSSTLSFSSQIFLPSIFYSEKNFLNLLGKLSTVWRLFQSCTYQFFLIALAQECECLHFCGTSAHLQQKLRRECKPGIRCHR